MSSAASGTSGSRILPRARRAVPRLRAAGVGARPPQPHSTGLSCRRRRAPVRRMPQPPRHSARQQHTAPIHTSGLHCSVCAPTRPPCRHCLREHRTSRTRQCTTRRSSASCNCRRRVSRVAWPPVRAHVSRGSRQLPAPFALADTACEAAQHSTSPAGLHARHAGPARVHRPCGCCSPRAARDCCALLCPVLARHSARRYTTCRSRCTLQSRQQRTCRPPTTRARTARRAPPAQPPRLSTTRACTTSAMHASAPRPAASRALPLTACRPPPAGHSSCVP